MNKERILETADFLETIRDEQLDMEEWLHPCGTIGCIAGWICQHNKFQTKDYYTSAQLFLGLTILQANHLFLAEGESVQLKDIKKHHAVQALRDLAKFGDFSWWEIVNDDDRAIRA